MAAAIARVVKMSLDGSNSVGVRPRGKTQSQWAPCQPFAKTWSRSQIGLDEELT